MDQVPNRYGLAFFSLCRQHLNLMCGTKSATLAHCRGPAVALARLAPHYLADPA